MSRTELRAIDQPQRRVYLDIHQIIKMPTQDIFRALSDPTRREILKLLKPGSRSAGELAEYFSISKGSLSHHFNVLKAAELVRTRREGQQIIYSLNTSVFEDAVTLLVDLLSPAPMPAKKRRPA